MVERGCRCQRACPSSYYGKESAEQREAETLPEEKEARTVSAKKGAVPRRKYRVMSGGMKGSNQEANQTIRPGRRIRNVIRVES